MKCRYKYVQQMEFNNNRSSTNAEDANIDSTLSLNPPPHNITDPIIGSDPPPSSSSSSFPIVLSQETVAAALAQNELLQQQQQQQQQQPAPTYAPAKLFQATGDVRNLERSNSVSSGFTVQIYDRHIRTWISHINFLDIAIRGQLYILWKSAWIEQQEPTAYPIDR